MKIILPDIREMTDEELTEQEGLETDIAFMVCAEKLKDIDLRLSWERLNRHRTNKGTKMETTTAFKTPVHDFAWALSEMKAGKKVVRDGWKNEGDENNLYIFIWPKEKTYNNKDLIITCYRPKDKDEFIDWGLDNADILANDWYVYEE